MSPAHQPTHLAVKLNSRPANGFRWGVITVRVVPGALAVTDVGCTRVRAQRFVYIWKSVGKLFKCFYYILCVK